MEKLKGYLGIVIAIALLVAGFIDVGPTYRTPMASRITPLDKTLMGTAAMHLSDTALLWSATTDHLSACRTAPPVAGEFVGGDKCFGNYRLFSALMPEHFVDLTKIEPKLPEMLKEYEAGMVAERLNLKSGTITSVFAGRELMRDPMEPRSARNLELERQMSAVLGTYVAGKRGSLEALIYGAHAGLVIVALLLVRWRRAVGGVILWPVSLLIGGGAKAARAAKGLHDKV